VTFTKHAPIGICQFYIGFALGMCNFFYPCLVFPTNHILVWPKRKLGMRYTTIIRIVRQTTLMKASRFLSGTNLMCRTE